MKKLIFDIETVGEDFDSMDELTQKSLTRWLKNESRGEQDYEQSLNQLKLNMGFSPLTGQVVAIGVLDADDGKGAVYFQSPDKEVASFEEDGIKYEVMTESDMLKKFWELALRYDEFITYNGRAFDVPFLMVRSAIHKIRPTKDLMKNRYTSYHSKDAVHVDLQDQLTFYGAVRKKGSLHLWTRAFGIESPKDGDISGEEVGIYYKAGKYLDIAKYNSRDLWATKSLYDYWNEYIRFNQ